jgi:nucleolin
MANDKKRKLQVDDEVDNKRAKLNDGQVKSAGRTLFVGGLPYSTTEDQLKTEFSKCGEIEGIRMTYFEDTGRCKGTAFITYLDASDAAKAQKKWDKQDFGGRYLVVNVDRYGVEDFDGKKQQKRDDNSKPRTGSFVTTPRPDNCDTLFVANLPWAASEDDLSRAFEKFGEVASVRLPIDQDSGKKKGFGYVQFSTGEDTEVAMKAAPISVLGREVRLDYSAPRDRSGGGDRNGGFNRGGDRNGGFNRGGDRNGGFNRGGDRNGGFNRGGDRNGGFNRGGDRNGGDRKPFEKKNTHMKFDE